VQRLIAVLRRPQGIFALVSEPTRPFTPPGGAAGAPYGERTLPLSAVSETVCPWRDKDVRAWRALASVPRLTERAGLAMIRAVIGSVADPAAPLADAPPEAMFGGASVDMRPHLCHPDSEQRLLEAMGDALAQATGALDFPAWHWTRRRELTALPAGFRRSVLWGLHLSPWETVEATLAAYHQLALDDRGEDLRPAVARLLSLAERPTGLAWCRAITQVPATAQPAAVELVLESKAFRAAPSQALQRALAAESWPDAWAAARAAREPRAPTPAT
jgi:hypothetical protein